MSLSKCLIRFGVFSLCVLFLVASAHAQFKASIQGTVMDPQGNAVGGAKVTITNQDTGVVRSTVTPPRASIASPNFLLANTRSLIGAAGFNTSTTNDVVVEAEQPRGFDVTIAVGNVQQSVTVIASAGELDTENANVNTTIGTQEVLTLPQFGRDPYELLHMAPGVFGDNARQGNGNSFALPQQVGPDSRFLGENAKLEIRSNFFNALNILNLNLWRRRQRQPTSLTLDNSADPSMVSPAGSLNFNSASASSQNT